MNFIGRRLGDFEIVRELGRGGMGTVYEAEQISLHRRVALKVLTDTNRLTRSAERFHREAEAAAKLHHTHIVPVYATGEEDGILFYAMELIDGPSLGHVVRRMRGEDAATDSTAPTISATTGLYISGESGGFPGSATGSGVSSGTHYFDAVARMIADVADALDHAHQQNVIHRDVKPSNLLLSATGRLSVTDFGLARMLELPGVTVTGEFVGTPAYMSPEQVTAGRIPLDHRTDVYSLGATLYELLTLHRPFAGDHRDQVLAQVVQKDPVAPRTHNPKVPVDLETICLKCLEKDPDRRYRTAKDLGDDLRRYLNRFAIVARRVGPLGRVAKWVRRHPELTGVAACALLAVAVAAVFAVQYYQTEAARRVERELARDEVAKLERDRALEHALAAAMGGDLVGAEAAIDEAAARGAGPGAIRLLRGQVAFYRGDVDRALVDLEEAAAVDPDSAAAKGMLAVAYLNVGDWARYEQVIEDLNRVTPRTVEDFIFQGYARYLVDPAQALETMTEAVKRSRSPLARAIRADVRQALAEDRADLAEAERALADLAAAEDELADSPFIRSIAIEVKLTAADLYEAAGNAGRAKALTASAGRDADALAPVETRLYPFEGRWIYFNHVGRDADALALARRAAQASTSPICTTCLAEALYHKGDTAEALQALDGRRRHDHCGDILRILLLAERNPRDLQPARTAWNETVRHAPEMLRFQVIQWQRLLGPPADTVKVARDLRAEVGDKPYFQDDKAKAFVTFCCGDGTEGDYLKSAEDSKWEQCEAHFYIALARLGDGDRAGAKDHFRKALDSRLGMFWEYDWSRLLLHRMESDPAWPIWIPIKGGKDRP
jgi:tetratricopeptide (TPR) repeat protein